jgi:MauM/NapG family ferredoxin protein
MSLRRTVQGLSLLLFTLLFLLATYTLPPWVPADLYLRLDPLLGLSALAAGRELIPRPLWSLLLIAATVLVGRFFCGYVCPTGAVIDFLDPVFFRSVRRPGLTREAVLRRVKYAVLVAIFAAAAGGLSLAYLLDPIALLTRQYTFVLYPLLITVVNIALDLVRPLCAALGWIELAHLSYPQPVYYMTLVTFGIFAAIIALSRYVPRFWCRFLCPLGALLSLASPLGLFRRQVSEDCSACLECQAACPMGTAEADPGQMRLAECIQCKACAEACPQGAISFPAFDSPRALPGRAGEYAAPEMSRRGFVTSATGGLAAAFLVDRTPFSALQGKHQLIRPPGALPEMEFLRTCVRCGECMKSCVTNTLQPCLWESGMAGLWTPRMDLRFAPCEQHCSVCGRVCPTQAIRSLPLAEKTYAKVGTAIIRRERCLVWAQDKLCLICDEICPYNAIVFRTIEGYRRPVVIAPRCNGCGFCEQRCPVLGDSAIIVVPDGEIRLKDGSYLDEARKRQLQFTPDPGDDKFLLEESGLQAAPGESPAPPGAAPRPPAGTTPRGFQ